MTQASEHWIVDVEDVRDVANNIPGYKQRFTFIGEDAAARAWVCWASAEKAGFSAKAEQVRKVGAALV